MAPAYHVGVTTSPAAKFAVTNTPAYVSPSCAAMLDAPSTVSPVWVKIPPLVLYPVDSR